MNTFRRHIPTFIDIDETELVYEFETTEDLLNLEVIQRCKEDELFSHFALAGNCLMEVLKEGLEWWVIGYIEDPYIINLPQWEEGK